MLLVVFVWLDAFALMNLERRVTHPAAARLRSARFSLIRSVGRMLDTPADRLFALQPLRRAVDRGSDQGCLPVIAALSHEPLGYKLDAVISGFAIGAGFSVVENILYLDLSFLNMALGTWLVRGFGTAIMHGTTLAVLAAYGACNLRSAKRGAAAAAYDFNPTSSLVRSRHAGCGRCCTPRSTSFRDRPLVAMMGAIFRRTYRTDRSS